MRNNFKVTDNSKDWREIKIWDLKVSYFDYFPNLVVVAHTAWVNSGSPVGGSNLKTNQWRSDKTFVIYD